MGFWTFVLFSLVANGYSRRIDREPISCPLTCYAVTEVSGYSTGKTYTYEYNTQAVSKVSGTADQQTGNIGFSSKVTLHVLGACNIVVNFENIQSSTVASIKTLSESLSKHPLHLSWQNGRVEEICSHVQEDTTTLNIKKGFLSAIQKTFPNNQADSYESDVTGTCLTSYSTESGPGASNTVRKTKDFTKCTGERSRYQTSILFNKYQADSKRKSLLKSSQDCNQTWTQEGVLSRSTCKERHVFRPLSYRSKGAESVVTLSLELLNVRDFDEIATVLTEVEDVRRSTLMFENTPNEDLTSEDDGPLTTAIEEMCDLVSPNAPSDLLPAGYLKIVGTMKGLKKVGLRRAWDSVAGGSVCSSQQDKIKQMFLDSLSMCDTESCVRLMVELISSHSVEELQKSAWISSISFISQPTEAIIMAVVPLVEGLEGMNAEPYLTLGSLVNRFCRNNLQCERNEAIQEAVAALQIPLGSNCHTTNEMEKRRIILSLRALGNAGQSTAIPVINACVLETRNSPDVRLAAMTAFRRVSCLADRSSLRVVLGDQQEDSEVRIAAYSAMMRCPSPDVLRYVVLLMQTEEVNQVGSYIWNHVMEVKSSSDPLKGYLRALFTRSNLSDKFSKDKRKYSSYYEKSIFSETLNIGAALDGDLVWSTKSFIPRSARLNLTIDLFGGAFNLFEIGGRVQGIERALERMIGPAAQENAFLATMLGIDKTKSRNKRQAVTKYDGKLQEIKERQTDLTKEDETSASVFMRMFGNEMVFKQFGEEIVQPTESGSWFGGLKAMFNLATGAEYSMQHSRMLADSSMTVPTIAGFPLTLTVAGASTMDVSFGGQIDLNKILFEGFHVGGYVKPKGTVEIKASMSTCIGAMSRAGIDLQTTLMTSMDVNGTVSLTDGQNFRVKVDVPQDRMDVVNFRSQIFIVQDEDRTSLVPTAPMNAESRCTETGSQLLGIQVCFQSSGPSYSDSADDERPFFPFAGPVDYQFDIRKTDPSLSYYLLETRYDWQTNGESSIPDEVSARFFVGTPGSQVDRSKELNILFTSTSNNFNVRLSTADRSLHIQGHKQDAGSEKSAGIEVTIDEMQTYLVDANMLYEKSRSGGHIWNGNARVSTPSRRDSPPTISGSFGYSEGRQVEGRIEIANVLQEPIVLQADAEKTMENNRASYNGNGRVQIPGIGNADGQMRSSSRDGRDRTHLSLNYALFGLEQQTVTLSHKYNDKSSEEESQWSIVTDASFSQFPSLNHKIKLEHSSSGEQLDSNLVISYGSLYDQKANTRKFAIKQLLSNLSDDVKTHVEASWSLSVPEYDVDYRASLRHVFDWTTSQNKMAVLTGSFSNSQDSSPLSFDVFASDKSTERKTKLEGQLKFSTPWAAISILQRLSSVEPGRMLVFGNYALGQASGLQMQMVSNITNLEREVGLSMHLYRPEVAGESQRGRTLNHDSSYVQPLPSAEDIFLFSTEWSTNTEWIPQNDFRLTGQTSLKSLWNNQFEVTTTLSQETTGAVPDILVAKRINLRLNHPSKELRFVGEVQTEKSTQNNLFPNADLMNRNFSAKFYWSDAVQALKHLELTGEASRYFPSNGKWNGAENRFDVSFGCQHNDQALTKYLPTSSNFDVSFYARPIVASPSFEMHHMFGTELKITIPSLWNDLSVHLSNEMRIGSTDFTNFDLSKYTKYTSPSKWQVMGFTFPEHFENHASVYNTPTQGSGLLFNVTIDNDKSLSMEANLRSTQATAFSVNAKWRQNLSSIADIFALLPRNVKLEVEADSSDDQTTASANVVVGEDDEQRACNISASINTDERQILLQMQQNLPYLINDLNIPSPVQINLRMLNRDQQETSTILEISSARDVLLTGRVVLSTPQDLTVDPYSLRFLLEHNTQMPIPILSEVVLSAHWNPESKYSTAIRMALGSQEAQAEIQMEVAEALTLNFNHRQDLPYLNDLGVPRKSSIVISRFLSDGMEVTCRVDSFKAKFSCSATTERVEAGSVRSRLVIHMTHNSAWLQTNVLLPKKVRGSLVMEGTSNPDQSRTTSSIAMDVKLGDRFVRGDVEHVRQNEDGNAVSAEIAITGSHNLDKLNEAGVPDEFNARFNVHKVFNGFRLRMSRLFEEARKHVELTIYQRDIMNGEFPGVKLAAQLSHSLDYLENAGLPQSVSATLQLEELDCCIGFWANGELELGSENTIRAMASVNCNGTSTTFSGNSDASGYFVTYYGVPETVQAHVEAYAFHGDQFAGLVGQVSVDDNTDDFKVHLTIPELRNAQDSYQVSVQHTFAELNTRYNIPFNFSAIFTGKITPWSYAKGNMEFRIDDQYKFFRFNTGYRFNPEEREYKFDYSMRHNLAFTSTTDEDQDTPSKFAFGLKMKSGYSVWWDFAMFQERLKGKIGVDVATDMYGFTYNVRHTFGTLVRMGVPKAVEMSASLLAGANNTFGAEFNAELWRRQLGLTATFRYQPGHQTEVMELELGTRHDFLKLQKFVPNNLRWKVALSREGSSRRQFSFFSVVNEDKTKFDVLLVIEPESYQNQMLYTVEISRDPVDFSLFASSEDLEKWPVSVRASIAQPRNRNRVECGVGLLFSSNRNFHLSFGGGQTRASEQEMDVVLEMTSNVPILRSRGIPDAIHSTANMRVESGETNRRIYSWNFRTSNGKHIDLDLTVRRHSQDRYEISYISSQNFQYLSEGLGYPLEMQISTRLNIEEDQITLRARVMLEQRSHYTQVMIHFPTGSSAEGRTQLSRSLQVSHDIPYLQNQLKMPRDVEIVFNFDGKYNPSLSSWIQSFEELRPSFTVNIDQVASLETSAVLSRTSRNLDATINLQHDLAIMNHYQIPRSNRLSAQLQAEDDNQMLEVELVYDGITQSVTLRTTNQIIAVGTKRAHREASFSVNHRIIALQEVLPNSMKVTARHMIRKILPAFEVGATLWFGHSKFDVTTQLNEMPGGETRGYALRFGINQDFRELIQMGVPEMYDVVASLQPSSGTTDGGTAQITFNNNGGEVNSVAVTMVRDGKTMNVTVVQDVPQLISAGVPQTIKGSLYYLNIPNSQDLSARICYEERCLEVSALYLYDGTANAIIASFDVKHDFAELTKTIPSVMSTRLTGHLTPAGVFAGVVTMLGENSLSVQSGFNFTLLTGEWAARTEMSHTWPGLEQQYDIPRDFAMSLSMKRANNDRCDVTGNFRVGSKAFNARVVSTTTEDGNYGDFTLYESHNFERLALMQIPSNFRLSGSFQTNGDMQTVNLESELNRFLVNTTFTMTMPASGLYEMRVENSHNIPEAPISNDFTISITAGSSDDSGYEGEIRTQRGRKKNSARLTAKKMTTSDNANSFKATLRQDMTTDLEESSVWRQLASSIDVNLNANINSEDSVMMMRCSVGDQSFEINFQQTRQPDNQWRIAASVDQSVNWIQNAFPKLPTNFAITGDVSGIENGYRGDLEFQYGDLRESMQIESTYGYNRDTRRKELVLQTNHDSVKLIQEYEIPRHIRVTIFHNSAKTEDTRSVSGGILLQLGEKQLHATVQASMENVANEFRPVLRLSVDTGHDTQIVSQRFGVPRSLRISADITPTSDGMTFQTRITQEATENTMSGSISAVFDQAEQTATLTINLNHDMNVLKEAVGMSFATQIETMLSVQNNWREIRGSVAITSDECHFRSASTFNISDSSLEIQFQQDIQNSPLLQTYLPSSLKANFEVQLRDSSVTVSYVQTIDAEIREITATCGFANSFGENIRLEINASFVQSFPTLNELGFPSETRIAFTYRRIDGQHTVEIDVALGSNVAAVAFTLKNAEQNVRVSVRTEGLPRDVRGAINFLWGDRTFSTALEYSLQPAENNRADVTVTWSRDPTNKRNEVQLELSHNIGDLAELGITRENSLTLFVGQPKERSWLLGFEINLDEKSLQANINIELQQSKITATIRGRNRVPWLTNTLGMGHIGKMEMTAQMDELNNIYGFEAKSTIDGETRQLLNVNVVAPSVSSSGIKFLINVTHDLPVNFAKEIEVSVDSSWRQWERSSTNVALQLGEKSVTMVNSAAIIKSDSGFLYSSALHVEHNLDILMQLNIPAVYKTNMEIDLAKIRSSLNMTTSTQSSSSAETKVTTVVLSYLSNETCAIAYGEVSSDWDLITMPRKVSASVYLHTPSNLNGKLGYEMTMDSYSNQGNLAWSLVVVKDGVSELSIQVKKESTGQEPRNLVLSGTVGSNPQKPRQELVILVNHSMEQLDLPRESRLCFHLKRNDEETAVGFNASSGQTNVNAQLSYTWLTHNQLQMIGELHHNVASWMDGGTASVLASVRSASVSLQAALTRDVSPEVRMEVNANASFSKDQEEDGMQNVFILTFNANHNIHSDIITVPRSVKAEVTVNTVDLNNASIGVQLFSDNEEKISFNTGYNLDRNLNTLNLHVASQQKVTESLPRKTVGLLGVNAKRYTSEIEVYFRLTRDEVLNQINGRVSYVTAVPLTNITAQIDHDLDTLNIPRVVRASVEVVVPSKADLILSIENSLTLDDQTWTVKSVMDGNVYRIGSDRYPLGRMDLSFVFVTNLSTVLSVPSKIDIGVNITRVGNYIFDSSLTANVNNGEKVFEASLSNAQSGGKANSIELQFSLDHNLEILEDVPPTIKIQASGSKVEGGFSFSIFSNVNQKRVKLGEMLVQRRFNGATNRQEFTLTFDHSSNVLLGVFIPEHFELNAYKEVSGDTNAVTVYSYDLTASGKSHSSTLTLTPNSFDLTLDHDWVTLSLITGLPYATFVSGKAEGSFPYYKYNLTYSGDLRKLETTLRLSKELEHTYEFETGLTHNMKTWQILGVPMRNLLKSRVAKGANDMEGNLTLTLDKQLFTTAVGISREESQTKVYRMDISTEHNMALAYPENASLRGEVSLSEDSMVNAVLTLSFDEANAVLRHTGSYQFQDWPQRGSMEATISFENGVLLLTDAGVPRSIQVTTSMERATIKQDTGRTQVELNGDRIFNVVYDKEENSVLQLSVDFGSNFVINIKDNTLMEEEGLDFQVEFGDASSNKSVFSLRNQPLPLLDLELKLDAPSFIPEDFVTGPIMVSLFIDETETESVMAELKAVMGEQAIAISLQDVTFSFDSAEKWSLSYVLAVQHNVTLMEDKFGLPNNFSFRERTMVDTALAQLMFYQLQIRSNDEEKLLFGAEVNKDDQSELNLLAKFNLKQSFESFDGVVPDNAQAQLQINARNDNIFGRVLAVNVLFQASGDQMCNVDVFCGIGNVGAKFGGGLSHRNIIWLTESMPLNDEDNLMEAQLELVGQTTDHSSSVTFHRRVKVSGLVGDRQIQSQYLVERRETGKEFGATTINFNVTHNVEELTEIGIAKSLNLEASSVAYSDSAKVAATADWTNEMGESKLVNMSMQYDGGFPARVHGSHTLSAQLNHPFPGQVPSQISVNGNFELSDSHIMNDWRVSYDGKKLLAQKRLAVSENGLYQADVTVRLPFQIADMQSLDISSSFNNQGKVVTLLGRVAVNEGRPTSVTGRWTSLESELTSRQGFLAKMTVEPGNLSQIVPQFDQTAMLEISAERTSSTGAVSFNATYQGQTVAASVEVSNRNVDYVTVDINVQQPFDELIIGTWPVSKTSEVRVMMDKRNTGRLIGTAGVSGDKMEDISLIVELMNNYGSTMYGMKTTMRRGENTNNDKIIAFTLNNNTYDSEMNFTGEATVECTSQGLFYGLVTSYAKSTNSRSMFVIAKYDLLPTKEVGLKWNDNVVLDRMELTVLSPILKPASIVFEKNLDVYGTQYLISTDLASVLRLRQSIVVGRDGITLSSGYSTNNNAGDLSVMGRSNADMLFIRVFLDEHSGPLIPRESDVALASLTRPVEGWMQLTLRSRRSALSKLVVDLDAVEGALLQLIGDIKVNASSDQMTPFFDSYKSKLERGFAWMKTACRDVQTSNLQRSYLSQNEHISRLLSKLGMPLDQLRTAYYDSLINVLKDEVQRSTASFFGAAGHTKLGWMFVKYTNEIIMHRIDTLDRKLYELVTGSAAPSSRLLHLGNEELLINFPTVYPSQSLGSTPTANVLRDWLAGTVATKVIRQILGYNMRDSYYRWIAEWNADTTAPLSPGFASVINDRQIATFDGKLFDLEVLGCAHLLSQDYLDGNFSLVMQRTPEGASSYLLKTKDAEGVSKTLQIHSSNSVTVNSQAVRLPYEDDVISIVRTHSEIVATAKQRDVILKCTTTGSAVCQLQLGPFYHGRVSGLMGTMDNEPENDMVDVEGNKLGDPMEEQESWAVVTDTNSVTCSSLSTSSSSCREENNVCEALFESSDSDLRACFPVVNPRPYLDACRRRLCDQDTSCSLAAAYRLKCSKLGAKISTPETCVTCPVVSADQSTFTMETVFVMEGGSCFTDLRETLPRLLRLLGANEVSRYGLVVYGTKGVQIHTITNDGLVMGTAHSLEKMLKHLVVSSDESYGHLAMEALKQAALYPFAASSKRNVVMLTCSDCQQSANVDVSAVTDLFSSFEINFHLLRNQGVATSRGNKPSKNVVVGYDKTGAFTKKSIRGDQPVAIADQMRQVLVSPNDVCQNMLSSVTDGSVWSANQLATRTRTAGKLVTAAVAKRFTGVAAARRCESCKCISLPEGIVRQVCGAC